MVRRLVVAVVGVVAGALVVAGLGTLALVQVSARSEARRELARQAAAAPVTVRSETITAVVLTRTLSTGLRPGARWFALASGATLVAAVAVAWSLGRRLTEPVRAAEAATRRVAAGDLSVRVPVLGTGDELDALAASVNAMAEDLQRSRNLERQFLMSVSHDLRTPLTSIGGYAEAIADGAAPDPRQAAEVIAAESRRLERLVRDLLDLARLDARRFSLELRPTDLVRVVAGSVEAFRPTAAAAGLILTLDAPDALPPVAADAERLAQVAGNLLDNACRFAASSVAVSVSAGDDGAVVAVDDNGPGIPPDELPRVFERLYTSGRAPVRAGGGSGLGLAIVRELAEAMGGSVEAHSPPPGRATGTRIAVRLRRWSAAPDGPGA